jgi:DNA-binding NtrC family response regulator
MSSASSYPAPVNSLQGRRVVLVDDDRPLLDVLTTLLQGVGCIVTPFERFQDAKTYLRSQEAPDILVTDVRLGAFNGLQLAVMCNLGHPELMKVVITGYDDPVLRKDAESVGARYLIKPLNIYDLVEALAEYVPGV